MALLWTQSCGFIADMQVRDLIWIGSIAEAISSTFLKRASTKEDREKTLQDIMARQIKSEQGVMVPLHIFPEACSTNGTSIIKLSKGAFYSLRKVRPMVFNYTEGSQIKASQDVAGFLFHTLVVIACLGIRMDLQVLPVFEPNEFFWKNHWREGKEEKWECYARVIQEIMADVGKYK